MSDEHSIQNHDGLHDGLGGRHVADAQQIAPHDDTIDPEPPLSPDLPGRPGGPTQPDVPLTDPPSTPGGPETPPVPQEPNPPSPDEPTVPTPDEPQFGAGDEQGTSSAEENSERFVHGGDTEADLSVLAKDAAHPFDQTNGIIDRLEGDADDPERVEERLNPKNDRGPLFPASPGSDRATDDTDGQSDR
ncbi:hypothetical protein [Humibacter ginsenosidimutans]|uniref:Uncharacterized protein n=1 Tax=Humibacter ginsenosidimutans TaxID=2599293 RepID=A0A5B8M4B5_9MICO|nr:hypothetical protein [Humibacter ginsenosidimutans]QDZ15163.1 hypothetical protein FPZ11_10625 [Humibacter ginsenosidimutans]